MKVRLNFLVIALFVLMSSYTIAQDGYKISTGKRILNFKDSTVFVLEVDRAIEKDVINSWKKSLEKRKIKAEIKNDQLTVKGIIIESVDNDPMNIYSTIVQQDNSVKLYSVFIVDSLRVDPDGKEGASVKVRKLLANFGTQVYIEVLTRELKEKNVKLKELVKIRDNNLEDQDDAEKDIHKDSLRIQSEETEISLLKGQLEGATDRYTVKKNSIASIKFVNKDDAKSAKSELKELDKERKSIEKEIQKRTDKILELKSEIRNNWYEIKQLKETEERNEEKLIKQREIAKSAEEELSKHSS
jgi:hypothetical protein